ncbi:hypothetical protein FHG87_003086 [Trinorchestia longiramus]|nr:hypothetical protein FHG87_003086 [Trinorchestia longiramus]
MSSNIENQMFMSGDVPLYGSVGEQCLMVDKKCDDATMLNQTLTTFDTTLFDHSSSLQGNGNTQLLDLNDDIYALYVNEDALSIGVNCNENFSSNNFNLENTSANSHLDKDVSIYDPNCAPSYALNGNSSFSETLLSSDLEALQESTPSTEELLEAEPSSSDCKTITKTRRRRRCSRLKEKLYMKTEPFSDEEMEKKRLNALKARNNRMKHKDKFQAMEMENSQLRHELQLSKSKIIELEKVVAALQENNEQKKLRLYSLRDQFSAIIDQ